MSLRVVLERRVHCFRGQMAWVGVLQGVDQGASLLFSECPSAGLVGVVGALVATLDDVVDVGR